MDVGDRKALGRVALHAGSRDLASFVGGIIEDLYVQKFVGIIELSDRVHETLDNVALVEDGKLYGNLWPVGHRRRRPGDILAIDVILIEQSVAVHTVSREDKKHDEIGNHHGQVERIGVIPPAKGLIRNFVPIVAERALLGREKIWGEVEQD